MRTVKLILLLIFPLWCFGQTLIDTPQGDEINLPDKIVNDSTQLLAKVNSSTESIEVKYTFLFFKELQPDAVYGTKFPPGATRLVNRYYPLTFGFKIKPVDGIGNIYSKGDFQGAMAFNGQFGFFTVKDFLFLKDCAKFLNFSATYSAERLTLFYPDRPFENQIDKSYFKGLASSISAGVLLKGTHFVNLSFGYARKNNYSDLNKITINDFTIIEQGAISREYGAQETGRIGNFKKFDRYPVRLSYSFLPGEDKDNQKYLSLGFTGYYTCDFGNVVPLHTGGVIVFITKQDKDSGIRIPSLGVGLQAKDITDNLNKDNAFEKRLSLNISATISLL